MNNQQRYIQVFEHETIQTYVRPDGRFITSEQLDQLCTYNDQHGSKYFKVIRQGVKFKQFVGVIQIGRLTIEILPKTDNNDSRFWHNILLQMLAACKKIKRESASEAILRKRENTLLDLYIDMYLDEVEVLVHKGLSKKYLRRRKQTRSLKGKMLFSENLQKNLVHKEHFFTEHTIYSSDNIYNQTIKKGLEVISKLNCPAYLKDRAMGLSVFFQSISTPGIIKDKAFEQLKVTRNTEKYKGALDIARLIILNYSPDIKAGSENLLAILFDMNDLWEEYIFRQLLKSEDKTVEVLPQRKKKFWAEKKIRPDIVIKKGEETYIVDTKWKVLDQANPSDADLKQMYAYNLYWKSYKSVLLYPKTKSSPHDTYGKYHKGLKREHGCKLCFIDLLDTNNQLNRSLSAELLNKILE